MKAAGLFVFLLLLSNAASAEEVRHAELGFACAVPSGWRAVAEYTHIDLLSEKDIIHIYPATKWQLPAEEAFKDIADYFSSKGARIGERETMRESETSVVVWAPVEGDHVSFIAGIRRDERAWFVRVEPGDSTATWRKGLQESAFLEAARTVRAGRDSETARSLTRLDVVYEGERKRLEKLAHVHAVTYSLVESLNEVTGSLARITDDPDLGMDLYEDFVDPAYTLYDLYWVALNGLYADAPLNDLEKNLPVAGEGALPNRANAAVAKMLLDESETVLRYSAKTREAIQAARSYSQSLVVAKDMGSLNSLFSRAETRLDEIERRVRNGVIPQVKSLFEKLSP